MELTPDTTYSWESLDTDSLVLPNELLTYYLYKRELDKKSKKESQEKEDETLIKFYFELLEKEKEVHKDVFKIN